MSDPPRLALLVDGDNLASAHASALLAAAARHGQVQSARVYACAASLPDWEGTPGFRLIHAGSGKNAADLLLALDAMELALEWGFEGFALASSDGDFQHLAHRLRERGLTVVGLGDAKAPESFRMACTAFEALPARRPARAKPAAVASSTPPVAPEPGPIDLKIRALIAANSREGRGMRIQALGPRMHGDHGVRISTLPERTWRAYFLARPALYDLDPRGTDAHVRFRPEGFAGG